MCALFPIASAIGRELSKYTLEFLSQYVNLLLQSSVWSSSLELRVKPETHHPKPNKPFKVIIAAGLTSSHPEQRS